jgi:uncharacterized protein DUF1883
MRYAYHDLGDQQAGSIVTVRWRGGRADVLLLDPVSFSKYCRDKTVVFRAGGGSYGHPPARLSIPDNGHWYIVLDRHGYSTHAEATVEVQHPDADESQEPREEPLVQVR